MGLIRFCLFFGQFLSVVLMEVAVADPYVTNPGPIDSSVLYDQEKHVSSAVWDGQVQFTITRGLMNFYLLTCVFHQRNLFSGSILIVQQQLIVCTVILH